MLAAVTSQKSCYGKNMKCVPSPKLKQIEIKKLSSALVSKFKLFVSHVKKENNIVRIMAQKIFSKKLRRNLYQIIDSHCAFHVCFNCSIITSHKPGTDINTKLEKELPLISIFYGRSPPMCNVVLTSTSKFWIGFSVYFQLIIRLILFPKSTRSLCPKPFMVETYTFSKLVRLPHPCQ